MSNPIVDGFGSKKWVNEQGDLHRLDGPAIEWATGTCYWIINDKKVDEKDHPFIKVLKKYRLFSKWKRAELTEAEQILIKMSLING